MDYAYLTDKKPPKFGYTIQVSPRPPADKAKVHVLSAAKKELYVADLHDKEKGGDFELDLHRVKLADSPLSLKFVFEKEKDPGSPHEKVVPCNLAEPAPHEISVPAGAWLGQEVDLKVTKWAALVYTGGKHPEEVSESELERVGDAKTHVKWRVDGKDLMATGETVKLKIAKEHLGKSLHVEAYLGAPSGRATAKIDAFELVSIDPDESVKENTKFYVNRKGGEAKHEGRKITIRAHVLPAVQGVPVFFKIDTSKVAENRIDKQHLELEPHSMPDIAGAVFTDAHGVAKTTFRLSEYGGDQYRVSASLNPMAAAGDADAKVTRWFQVWRAIDLQVSVMQRPDGGIQSIANDVVPRFIKRWEEQFIHVRKTDARPIPFHRVIARTEAGLEQFSEPFRSSPAGPWTIHLCFVNLVAVGTAPMVVGHEHPGGWDTLDRKKPDFGALFFEFPAYCIDDSTIETAVDSTAWFGENENPDFARPLPVSGARVHFEERWHATGGDRRGAFWIVKIDLSSVLRGPDAPETGNVMADVKNWISYNGWSTSGHATFVGVYGHENDQKSGRGFTAQDVRTGTLMAALHESAHKIGLAAKTLPELPHRNNDKLDESMTGLHCNNGAPGHKCLMFAQYQLERGEVERRFCDLCADALRARPLPYVSFDGSAGWDPHEPD